LFRDGVRPSGAPLLSWPPSVFFFFSRVCGSSRCEGARLYVLLLAVNLFFPVEVTGICSLLGLWTMCVCFGPRPRLCSSVRVEEGGFCRRV